MRLEVGKTYTWGRWEDTAEPMCVFVVVKDEPWEPRWLPPDHVATPGFRVLVLDGLIPDAMKGDTAAGQQTVVAMNSAVSQNAKPL